MAHCERKRALAHTMAHVLLLAVVAAATVTGSRAWPIRVTRTTNIGDVQVNLKGSINALFLIIQSIDYPPAVENVTSCQLWRNVTTEIRLHKHNNSSSAAVTEDNLRSITCKKISEEITGFDLIQRDGSCSEGILDYLCDRQLQETESHSLYAKIDVDVSFLEWVREHFDESLANHISDLYK